MIENFKPINLKDFTFLVATAWVDLRATTISKSWKKLLGKVEDEIIEAESTDETEKIIISLFQRM